MTRASLCTSALLALAAGCRPAPPDARDPVVSQAERGPLALTVSASPAQPWVGDPIRVEVRFEAPDGWLARFPRRDAFGDVDVRVDSDEPTRSIGTDERVAWTQSYTLSTLYSGELEIPPLVVAYARRPENPDEPPRFENELAAGSIRLQVRSALTSQDAPTQPRDITETLAIPPKPLSPAQWALIAAGLLLAAAVVILAARSLKARLSRPPPPIPAESWALGELERLERENLVHRGQGREYYYRLTEIVREYIERKFGLAAPEMTTEEFLSTLASAVSPTMTPHGGSAPCAVPYDPVRLALFLEPCDLVKYAALEPDERDARQAMIAARDFVTATAAADPTRPLVEAPPRGEFAESAR